MMGVTVTTAGPPKIRRDALRRALKETFASIGKDWHDNYRPLHFTTEGARRYHYAARRTKEVTTGSIRRRKGGRPRAPSGLPLVWSGRSRTLSQSVSIRATYKGVRVVSPIRAFNFRPPGNPNLDMRAEYTRVIGSELREIERKAAGFLDRLLARADAKVTVKIDAIA
jgi:hypothetical protein